MSPRKQKILAAWLCAALLLAFAQSRGWLRPIEQKGALLVLERKISAANKDLPQASGEGVQIDSMQAGEEDGKLFVRQNLTLLQMPSDRVDPRQVRDMIRPAALDSYCKGPMSKPNPFFDVVFHVAVFSSDRQPITDIALEPADCPAP